MPVMVSTWVDGISITGNNIHDNDDNAIMVDLLATFQNPDFETDPRCVNLGGSTDISASSNTIVNNGEGFATR